MWNYSEDQWQKELLSSLKKTELPVFLKTILTDTAISPFSLGTQAETFQKNPLNNKFLAIQNYEDLKRSKMTEWIESPDVGFRFRQMHDIPSEGIPLSKTMFLSQPFPFLPSMDQEHKIHQLMQHGHQLHLGWSPLSFGLTRGEILKKPFAQWDQIFKSSVLDHEAITWFYLSSAPYQWAGAEPHMELGILLSLAYSTLSELNAVGVSAEKAFRKFSFGLALGTDILVESSKIAALKILWTRLGELVLEDPQHVAPPEVYVLPSLRFFSGRDCLNNLLRTTLMALSAALGGANGFKCIPYDALNKNKSSEALRVSTNVPLLLKQEGLVTQVSNALDGAPLFAKATEKICEKSWMFFQEIEKKGGIFEAVRTGWLQMELKRHEEFSKNQLCYFQKELIGVNKYVAKNIDTSPTESGSLLRLSDIIDPLFLTKSPDDYLTVEPLLVHSVCYDWDVVQIQSDRYLKKMGHSPKVHLIRGGGPIVEKKISWLQQLCSIAGFEAQLLSAEESLLLSAETPLVILVPSQDEMEETLFTQVRAQIRGRIWSLNTSKENSKIDKFLQMDINALEIIKEMQSLVLEGV